MQNINKKQWIGISAALVIACYFFFFSHNKNIAVAPTVDTQKESTSTVEQQTNKIDEVKKSMKKLLQI
jgi:preprotein translocase subunit SecF